MFPSNMFLYSATALFAGLAAAIPQGCGAPVRVITVRGTSEILGQSSLRTEFSSILSQGVSAVLQGTPYPAIPSVQGDYSVYDGSVTSGVQSLQSIIQGTVQQCPQQKIVLLGYSQGANVVMDALCSNTVTAVPQLDAQQYGSHIAAIAVFGDPTHVVGQSFMQGGSYSNGMVPRSQNIQCAPYTDRIASYCHPSDPVCSVAGTDINQHLTYMSSDAGAAAAFIKSKL